MLLKTLPDIILVFFIYQFFPGSVAFSSLFLTIALISTGRNIAHRDMHNRYALTIKTASASRFYRSSTYSMSSLLSLSGVLGISLVLTGCGKSKPGIMPGEIPVMSENEVVQKAYERCVQDTQEALFKDNSVT
nr:hypothetical protein [Endozoicomonas sp.]